MQRARLHRTLLLAAVLLLLVLSLRSLRTIPFYDYLGLDFQNLFAFHHCAAKDNPYLATGLECGDASGRDMFYPPLLYFAFAWSRWVPFAPAAIAWSLTILMLVVASLALFRDRLLESEDLTAARDRILTVVFLALLAAQYPTGFAIERGNNDALVLALWVGAFGLLSRGHAASAGVLAGSSAALKIYPGIACVLAGCGLLVDSWRRRCWRASLRFTVGGVAAVALSSLIFVPQLSAYLEDELPRFAAELIPLTPFSHSLRLVWPSLPAVAMALSAILVASWVAALARCGRRDLAMAFAGALAISTYFSGTSYDYNLITTYPLLLLLFVRAFAGRSRPGSERDQVGLAPALLLVLGLAAVVGDRKLYGRSELGMRLHIALQWAWLMGTSAYVWAKAGRGRAWPGSPSPEERNQRAVATPMPT